jgi:hypothetical protein
MNAMNAGRFPKAILRCWPKEKRLIRMSDEEIKGKSKLWIGVRVNTWQDEDEDDDDI